MLLGYEEGYYILGLVIQTCKSLISYLVNRTCKITSKVVGLCITGITCLKYFTNGTYYLKRLTLFAP
jgi:hypothetical protein